MMMVATMTTVAMAVMSAMAEAQFPFLRAVKKLDQATSSTVQQ
jgi:hypothetical protein